MNKILDGIKLFFAVIGYGLAIAGIGFLRWVVILVVGGIIVAIMVVIGFILAAPLAWFLIYLSR